jgi:hypothetical protein
MMVMLFSPSLALRVFISAVIILPMAAIPKPLEGSWIRKWMIMLTKKQRYWQKQRRRLWQYYYWNKIEDWQCCRRRYSDSQVTFLNSTSLFKYTVTFLSFNSSCLESKFLIVLAFVYKLYLY